MNFIQTVLGLLGTVGFFYLLIFLFKACSRQVEDEHVLLVINFGKLEKTVSKPGLYFSPTLIFPWINTILVSQQKDCRFYHNIHVNDRSGTTLVVDLWIEFKIKDAEKALFSVENWEQSLKNLLTHSASSILGADEFTDILQNRTELGDSIRKEILNETLRWGLEVELVMIHKLSLLPEISQEMFASVSAQLERAKADIEEEGRVQVALLEAQTRVQVAELETEAKAQYPLAVGRAYQTLMRDPEIFNAYQELYDLSQIRPHRTVSFVGFGKQNLSTLDAATIAMSAPPTK